MGESERGRISEHERLTGIIATQRDIVALDIDVAAVLAIVAERALPLTGASAGAVEMVEGDVMVYRAASGSFAGLQGTGFPRASTLSGRCLEDGQVLLCSDAELTSQRDRDICCHHGVRSLAVVPLLHGTERVGVLKVAHAEADAFSERDIDTLEVLAALVSAVMSRASAIEERELKFRAFMDNSPMAAFLKDHEGRYVFVNAALERLVGHRVEDMIGKTAAEVFPPRAAAMMAARDAAALVSGSSEELDRLVLEGARRTWLTVVFPVADSRGRLAVGGMMHDVSSRLEAEEALRASEHRFRSLAEYASDAVISIDAAGTIVFWNHSAVRVFGYEASEAIGRALWTILLAGPDRAPDPSVLELFAARAAATQATPVELRARRKNGAEFPVEVSVSTWMSGDQRFYTAILRDVTERKLIQEQLSHATRLISIGTLASGIGHEINNPLSYVMYNLEFATETVEALIAESNEPSGLTVASVQKLGPLRDDLVEATNGADRIRAILRDLRTFSRAGDERRLAISVSRAADAAINMVFSQIRHQARVVKEYRDTALVDAVEGKLVQVIVNLLVNAAQATVPGRPEENVIAVRSAMGGDAWVVLEVSDTGTGIPAADLSRIFDPFYTTKGVGSGTGLGLSISHGIIQSFGGSIEVETELHRGSTFRVKLPASSARDVRTAQGPRLRTSPPPRRGRVMVIDDEPQVSASLQRMLAREHDVVAYTSSLAAAAELRSGARYDLILCDLMMPDLPGWQLYEGLTADQKECIAFMTGGAFHRSARVFLAGIKNPVLDKPIDAKQLRTLMRERITTA